MEGVLCADAHGILTRVAVEELKFSPAVYAIFIENNQILLQRNAGSYLWQPLGGLASPIETMEGALARHIRREVGVEAEIVSMLWGEEAYRIDAGNKAWHLSVFYYIVSRSARGRIRLDLEEASRCEWRSIQLLRRERMQFGYDAMLAGWSKLTNGGTIEKGERQIWEKQ